jgi:flagellar hook-associated protein 1 FlgK
MSISGTLNNALSGLGAASRAAEVVSSNIANSLTDGYGRRELQLSATSLAGQGGGVRVDGVARMADLALISDRRIADAELGNAGVLQRFYNEIESSIGLPGSDGSLSSRIDGFETSLIEASSRPDSQPRLMAALRAAEGVASQMREISSGIQQLRQEADTSIASAVSDLNTRLQKIADLNHDIRVQTGSGRQASGLMDQRQAMIDSISEMVSIREVPRDNGEIALITSGGAILLDGKAATFSFSPVGVMTADMTIASGALGKLSINGEIIDITKGHHAMIGGRIDALFRVRDTHAVEVQSAIDGVARDMMERFEDPNVDPTRALGAPGLFTDRGTALNIADEVGLAGRFSLNTAIDPGAGGEIWRLRTGLGAAGPGDAGDATQLTRMIGALNAERVPPSGGFMAATRSASGLTADLLSRAGADRQSAEFELTFAASKQQSLRAAELQNGVDSDHEMQQLLLVEQAYAANARVIQAVDDMLDQLLRL